VLRSLRSRNVLREVATLVTLALTLEVALITLPLLLLLGVAAKCVARSNRRVVVVVTGGVSLFNLFPTDLDRAWRPGEGGGPRATIVAGNVASVVAAVTLLLVLALLLLGRYVGK
jgi:hypothetical protein